MQNFVFHNPTKILFGRDTVSSLGNETSAHGRNVLLLYGKQSIKKNGLYAQATTSLKDAGVTFFEHGGVQSNPLLGHVRKGIEKVKQHNLEAIVAIGGGSVIDSAKAIAAGSTVNHDVWKFFIGKKSVKSSLPVISVLTLAASGSEMNSGMVLTNEDTKEKFGFGHRLLYPKTSILDPYFTYTVPPDYTAYGAIDAISHVLEFYMTTQDPDTPVQDRFIEGIIINSMESCKRCLKNPSDYNSRANLMWTATLALNGLSAAGLGRVGFPMHMIEHSLSSLYNVPHGAGLSVVIPGWMQWAFHKKTDRIAMLGRHIFPDKITHVHEDVDAAEKTISLLRNWFVQVNAPVTLGEINIKAADIPRIAENSMGQAKTWRLKNYSQQSVEEILHLCL